MEQRIVRMQWSTEELGYNGPQKSQDTVEHRIVRILWFTEEYRIQCSTEELGYSSALNS